MHRRLLAVLTALTTVLLLAVTSSGAPAQASPAGSHRPKVGTCYRLTTQQLYPHVNQGRVVPCSSPHTAMVFAVKDVPRSVDLDNDRSLGAYASKVCTPAYHRTVSRSIVLRLLTAYGYVFFAPNRTAEAHGQRWIECDVFLSGGHGLTTFTGSTTPFAASQKDISNRERRCLVGARHQLTSCAAPHDLRSTAAFRLAGRSYPSEAARQRAGAAHCSRYAKHWVSINPTAQQWRTGFHYAVCYRPTRH